MKKTLGWLVVILGIFYISAAVAGGDMCAYTWWLKTGSCTGMYLP